MNADRFGFIVGTVVLLTTSQCPILRRSNISQQDIARLSPTVQVSLSYHRLSRQSEALSQNMYQTNTATNISYSFPICNCFSLLRRLIPLAAVHSPPSCAVDATPQSTSRGTRHLAGHLVILLLQSRKLCSTASLGQPDPISYFWRRICQRLLNGLSLPKGILYRRTNPFEISLNWVLQWLPLLSIPSGEL